MDEAKVYDIFRRSIKPLEPVVTIDEVRLTDAQVAYIRYCVSYVAGHEPNSCMDPVAMSCQAMLLEGSPKARRAAGLL